MGKKRLGRPTKITASVKGRFVGAIAAGNYLETAAAVAGITTATMSNWLRRGKAELARVEGLDDDAEMNPEEEPYVNFFLEVRGARRSAEVRGLNLVRAHAFRDWKAAAWILERRNPRHWRARNTTELIGNKEKPLVPLAQLREFLGED